MKKIIALIIAIVTVFALAACTTTGKKEVTMDNVKIGVICLHDENSTYDANFINAVKAVQAKLGLKDEQVVIRTGVDESDACYKAAADMADSGCDIVFADSFGHESYMVQAAKEFPNVEFCHATGVSAKVQNIKNFHNAFASIYEGRFLAGIAAGMKLNEMISSGKITSDQAKIGYVGAWPYAEVISGYTSFFLGARYICPSATMKVVYTNSWFDIAKEKESAESLIKDGCVLISQHADSEGAPKACQAAGVPNIAYNVDTTHLGPDTAIISSKIDWEPYFELIINAVVKGEAIPTDYCGDFSTGSVALTKLNDKAAAPGTAEKIAEIEGKLKSGEIKVFATDSFKVKGETLSEYKADVDGDYAPDTNVIHDGYFDESNAKDFRSAPYFDMIIDGITVPET